MESFFGIGGAELILILVLATVILGPLRMIRMARQFGILLRDLRNYYTQLTTGLSEELAVLAEAKEMVQEGINAAEIKPEELQVTLTDTLSDTPANTAEAGPGETPTALSAPVAVPEPPAPLPATAGALAASTINDQPAAVASSPETSQEAPVQAASAAPAVDTTAEQLVATESTLPLLGMPPAASEPAAVSESGNVPVSSSEPAPQVGTAPDSTATPDATMAQPPRPFWAEEQPGAQADELGLL